MSKMGQHFFEMQEARFEQEETIEATLAFILIDLESLSKHGRFSIEQEDQLLAIENKARELRSKL